MKMIYAAAAALILCFAVTVYSENVSNDLENGLIRLHIVANSDSEEDQSIKLRIRDAVVSELDCSDISPDEAAAEAAVIAERVLNENGFSYGARGEFCTAEFPRREYKELTLPAGSYKTVRVTLGSGSGHNWWCVLYPPVCMADIGGGEMSDSARQLLRDNLDNETYELVTQSAEPEIKFRSAEIFRDIMRFVMGA